MNPPEDGGVSATSQEAGQLAATQQELDRLIKLRHDVASGLLEVSAAAKRDAERLLAAGDEAARPMVGIPSAVASWPTGLLLGSFAVGIACGLAIASLMGPGDAPVADSAVSVSQAPPAPPQPDIEPAASDTEPTQPEPPPSIESRPVTQPDPSPVPPIPAPRADGELVLVLTTHRECWLRTSVDGGSPSERTVAANQTVVLRAKQEAQIRIGDAAAVSLTINDRPTNSLGRDGQVVSLRVTPDNFQSFLANGP